jgi:hypothetical protein
MKERSSRTRAPISTRTRHALAHAATDSHQTDENTGHLQLKSHSNVFEGEVGATRRTDEDDDMAKILALLPAKKRAKLAAAR